LSPEAEIVYVISDGQITESPDADVDQVESEGSIFVPCVLNQHHSTHPAETGFMLVLLLLL
jgi:hypothetical protein